MIVATTTTRTYASKIGLLGTASLFTLSCLTAAAQTEVSAPAAGAEVVEQVLVTGSLIHGAAPVGVPVTSVGQVEFKETGALLVSDLLRTIPGVQVDESTAFTTNIGNSSRGTPVNIHNLNGGSTRTLMLIDGMRYPIQNQDTAFYDPSIIPSLAVERVDVLLDGASATYGSDAVAGVINVILRRGYDGAITQARVSHVDGAQGLSWQASQLWGHTWDGGNITLTAEYLEEAELKASKRSFYTYDYMPWGLDDKSLLRSSTPGVVSTGAPSSSTGTDCNNCYSVPSGQNGIGLTWATLLANKGVANEINPYLNSSLTPPQSRVAYVLTLDQKLIDRVSVFVDAFYSNRRPVSQFNTSASVGQTTSFTQAVPTINTYYPAGAPAGLRVSYNLGVELPPYTSSVSRGQRFATGFNLELPAEWNGRLSFQVSDNLELANAENLVNANGVAAAVGNTVAATATSASFTKPSNIPYLNLFCDPNAFTCNDPATLQYIKAYRRDTAHWITHEWNANFDGPVYGLPGGDVRAAIGGGYVDDSFFYNRTLNNTTVSPTAPSSTTEIADRKAWSAFAQVNVPIIGDANAMPLVRRLEAEFGYRYDRYNDFGATRNPKVSVDWSPVNDLTLRGSWGTSFRAPAFSDNFHGIIRPQNLASGAASNAVAACTTVGGTPTPGSAAAILNPTCSAGLQYQGGVGVSGGAGIAVATALRPAGYALGPEKATTLSTGFDYAPSTFLKGLTLNATYFAVKIRNAINGGGTDLNSATDRVNITVFSDPGFADKLALILKDPLSQIPPSVSPSTITFILDGAPQNVGSALVDGVDFGAHYDWDLGDWGSARVGADGTYYLRNRTVDSAGNATDPYIGFNTNAGLANATDSRLRARGQLGWTDGTWNAAIFINYRSHFYTTNTLPPANVTPANYSNIVPEQYTFDLSLGYDTGDAPANEYFRNINFQLVVNNITDRRSPFAYNLSSTAGNVAFAPSFSPVGREIVFTIAKAW